MLEQGIFLKVASIYIICYGIYVHCVVWLGGAICPLIVLVFAWSRLDGGILLRLYHPTDAFAGGNDAESTCDRRCGLYRISFV